MMHSLVVVMYVLNMVMRLDDRVIQVYAAILQINMTVYHNYVNKDS